MRGWRWRLVLLFLAAMPPAAHAKVFTFQHLNCSCTVPDDWTFQPEGNQLINVADPDRKRFFIFTVHPVSDQMLAVYDRRNIEKLIAQNGINISSESAVTVQGVSFAKIDGVRDLGNKSLYTTKYYGAADGYIYFFNFLKYDSSPDEDADLKAMFASFHFLKKPVITHYDYKAHFFWIGVGLLFILAVVALLAVWGLYAMFRQLVVAGGPPPPVAPPAAPKPARLYIYRETGNPGPFSREELQAQVKSGAVKPDEFTWEEGMADWVPVDEFLQQPAPVAVTPQEEQVRRRNQYLAHEAALRSVSLLHYLGGMIYLLLGLGLLILGLTTSSAPPGTVWVALLLLPLGAFLLWLGRQFQQLRHSIVLWGTIAAAIGLLAVPVGTLVSAYCLYLLHGKKGRTVLSRRYRAVIEATPEIRPPLSRVGLVLAGVFGLFFLVVLIVALMSAANHL